jgi:hypothetical protein
MNERIKELAEQAEDDVVADHRGDEFHKAYTQRFAELIVKECSAKIERDYKYERGEDTKWIIAFAIANDLKAHFGVEE